MTVLEAPIGPDREAELIDGYRELVRPGLPEAIVETFLVRAEGDVWRIVTIWRSRGDLDEFRASGVTPGGVLVFRAAGAEPILTVLDVVEHASH